MEKTGLRDGSDAPDKLPLDSLAGSRGLKNSERHLHLEELRFDWDTALVDSFEAVVDQDCCEWNASDSSQKSVYYYFEGVYELIAVRAGAHENDAHHSAGNTR
jgi:hypothetical protein